MEYGRNKKEIISTILQGINNRIDEISHQETDPTKDDSITWDMSVYLSINTIKQNGATIQDLRDIFISKLDTCISKLHINPSYKYASVLEWFFRDSYSETYVHYLYMFTKRKFKCSFDSAALNVLLLNKSTDSYLNYWS